MPHTKRVKGIPGLFFVDVPGQVDADVEMETDSDSDDSIYGPSSEPPPPTAFPTACDNGNAADNQHSRVVLLAQKVRQAQQLQAGIEDLKKHLIVPDRQHQSSKRVAYSDSNSSSAASDFQTPPPKKVKLEAEEDREISPEPIHGSSLSKDQSALSLGQADAAQYPSAPKLPRYVRPAVRFSIAEALEARVKADSRLSGLYNLYQQWMAHFVEFGRFNTPEHVFRETPCLFNLNPEGCRVAPGACTRPHDVQIVIFWLLVALLKFGPNHSRANRSFIDELGVGEFRPMKICWNLTRCFNGTRIESPYENRCVTEPYSHNVCAKDSYDVQRFDGDGKLCKLYRLHSLNQVEMWIMELWGKTHRRVRTLRLVRDSVAACGLDLEEMDGRSGFNVAHSQTEETHLGSTARAPDRQRG